MHQFKVDFSYAVIVEAEDKREAWERAGERIANVLPSDMRVDIIEYKERGEHGKASRKDH